MIWLSLPITPLLSRDGSEGSSSQRDGGDSNINQKRNNFPTSGGSSQSKRFCGNQGRGGRQTNSYPECPRFKKHHPEECNRKTCFQWLCGALQKDYPQLIKEEQKQEAKPILAQVFAITQADVAVSHFVVTSQLPVDDSYYTVLFDSGATHSYVASRVIDELGRTCDFIDIVFGTLLPSGEWVISKRWVRSMPIRIVNMELSVDLIELELTEFDIVLGMDSLPKYLASIYCKQKMVTFQPEGEEPFMFGESV
uniref:Gag-pol polyprotein n=1 Tax=Cannabis sativa TaxID=3483 RepID=A0A803PRF7_CANSA